MYLRSLTLQGFKSFGEKTTVEFHTGITAIVGPNGSGKSNIFDSLRWATGGGRASEFRAGEKTDLIFHGAAGKRSVGFAEVRIDIDKPEEKLNIARSIFRDGSSKLKLGGKNARFLDLDDSLAGTGLGRGGLAVIGQGKVSDVLMADSQKLLGYVQEAIGVARLSTRREQTLTRLQDAREHLERLEDIAQELERQLGLLTEEAQQKYQAQTGRTPGYGAQVSRRLRHYQGINPEPGQQWLAEIAHPPERNAQHQRNPERLSRLRSRFGFHLGPVELCDAGLHNHQRSQHKHQHRGPDCTTDSQRSQCNLLVRQPAGHHRIHEVHAEHRQLADNDRRRQMHGAPDFGGVVFAFGYTVHTSGILYRRDGKL